MKLQLFAVSIIMLYIKYPIKMSNTEINKRKRECFFEEPNRSTKKRKIQPPEDTTSFNETCPEQEDLHCIAKSKKIEYSMDLTGRKLF